MPSSRIRAALAVAAILLVTLALVAWRYVDRTPGDADRDQAALPALAALVSVTPFSIAVYNDSETDWDNVVVLARAGTADRQYRARIGHPLKGRDSVLVRLLDLVDDTGGTFPPGTEPAHLRVEATVAGERRAFAVGRSR